MIDRQDPMLVCLQETFLKSTDDITIENYTRYNHICIANEKATGGVSILVKENIPHQHITLTTNLQAVGVTITAHKTLTVCCIYLPPKSQPTSRELDVLLDQLPTPFVLLGDCNSHNPIWGSISTNAKGNLLEALIDRHNLCILNDKSQTYVHPANGTLSAIDLTLCDPGIFLDMAWKVHNDLCGSDHFPIFIKFTVPCPTNHIPDWRLHRADWVQFRSFCKAHIRLDHFDNDDPVKSFTSRLIAIASVSIPKSTTGRKRINKPWFNDECREAIKTRNKALKKLKTNPTMNNLNQFRICRAKARLTIKNNKKRSWRNFVSGLTARTPIKKAWDMVRKISGKDTVRTINHLQVNDLKITDTKSIANTLAEAFQKSSSTTNYSPEFQIYKHTIEKQKLDFGSPSIESYNIPFTLHELQHALDQSRDSAVGPDDIHYRLLKELPNISMKALLKVFNHIWSSGRFPNPWREAIIVPIPKPGKDTNNPSNYRPIALTSCMCKTMERMVNVRLNWYLERNNIISKHQSGFRRQRSTTDHLVKIETHVREALIKNEHIVAIFFDLEKAYDTTWKYGILRDMHEAGLRGHLPGFINQFLTGRRFRVRVGGVLSELHSQEMGVPQGSILSPTLFSLKINKISSCLRPNINCSLYVDDFSIYYSSADMTVIENQLQHSLNNLQKWCNENGFRFSRSKTVCMHFCHKRNIHPDPTLTLDNIQIPVVDQTKFLGIIFDKKLTFVPHIELIKSKSIKSRNLLRVVSGADWGADRTVLLRLYRSLIRSKLEYGCMVYGSARKSYLKPIETIQNESLRICMGAYKTSPISSLHVEANETPLTLRFAQLSAIYALKTLSDPLNPVHNIVRNANYSNLFRSKRTAIKTFGLRVQPILEHINNENIAPFSWPKTAPWLYTPYGLLRILRVQERRA